MFRFPTYHPPASCARCGGPFKVVDSYVMAIRSDGKLYCSDDCVDLDWNYPRAKTADHAGSFDCHATA